MGVSLTTAWPTAGAASVDAGPASDAAVGLGIGSRVGVGGTAGTAVGVGNGVDVTCGGAGDGDVAIGVGVGTDSGGVVGTEVGVTETTCASSPASGPHAAKLRVIDAQSVTINVRRFIFDWAAPATLRRRYQRPGPDSSIDYAATDRAERYQTALQLATQHAPAGELGPLIAPTIQIIVPGDALDAECRATLACHVDAYDALVTTQPMSAFGPDFTFAFDDWLSHSDGLGQVPVARYGTEVAIVGAGVAGLVTAYELMRLGFRPVVYEAGRIGGRLRSERFSSAHDVIAELGGMRFPIAGRAFFHYVDLLGLGTRPFPNPLTPAAPTTVIDLAGEAHYAETLEDLPELFRDVAAAWDAALAEVEVPELKTAIARRDYVEVQRRWDKLVEAWDDRTFYDFLATSDAFSKLSFRHREIFGQVGFGTGGWDSDFPNSMLEIFRVILTGLEDDQRLIVGGAEQVPRGIWTHAPGDCAHWPAGTSLRSLHQGAPRPGVAAISSTPSGGFEVTDRWGHVMRHDAVVVATQSWLLTTSIKVDEALLPQPVWMALDRTRYMQSSKTFVMVDRPFWKDVHPETGQQLMSMTLTDRNTRGTYLFDNGPDLPAVICLSYAWQSDAMKVLAMSAAERATLAIDTLETIYPDANLRQHVIGEPITVSWEADPLFLGAFKGAQPGHYRYNHRMYSHFMQEGLSPVQRGFFLAGDDTSWTPGWAEGAVHTALNAVWGVMTHFGGSSPEQNPGPGDLWAERSPVDLDTRR